jgi:hypothetical protein
VNRTTDSGNGRTSPPATVSAGPLLIEEGQVRAVFSPDGEALALVNETTKTVDVLDVADPSAPRYVSRLDDLPLSASTVDYSRYRPDERELTVSDQNGELLRFDLDYRRLLGDLREWSGLDEDRVDWARYSRACHDSDCARSDCVSGGGIGDDGARDGRAGGGRARDDRARDGRVSGARVREPRRSCGLVGRLGATPRGVVASVHEALRATRVPGRTHIRSGQ